MKEKRISTVADFVAALRGLAPGDVVALTVLRKGTEQTLEVRLGERPS